MKNVGMVAEIKADRTTVMRSSIRMVMKCQSQNGEQNADEQDESRSSMHQLKI